MILYRKCGMSYIDSVKMAFGAVSLDVSVLTAESLISIGTFYSIV